MYENIGGHGPSLLPSADAHDTFLIQKKLIFVSNLSKRPIIFFVKLEKSERPHAMRSKSVLHKN